jgi:hypothetical protein
MDTYLANYHSSNSNSNYNHKLLILEFFDSKNLDSIAKGYCELIIENFFLVFHMIIVMLILF